MARYRVPVEKIERREGNTGTNLITLIESRLDNFS